MMRVRLAHCLLGMMLVAGANMPAAATRGPVFDKGAGPKALLIAKEKSEKDTAIEAKLANGCKAASKSAPDSKAIRSTNCLKPRPILM